MSESIIVRVSLDSYDLVHPSEKQTQVYVQIPEVARVSWLLADDRYGFLKSEPWPSVVELAQEAYKRSFAVTDSVSAAARRAVIEWLADDANHDAMHAAWEADQARQHPVARKLLAENEKLRARVAVLEESPLAWADKLDAKSLDNFLICLSTATEYEPMCGAIDEVHQLIRSFREHVESGPSVDESADRLTGFFAPVAGLREDDPNGLHHTYLVSRDLPGTGGVL
jgi:hypothetical protein